jgi:hypothetical protein
VSWRAYSSLNERDPIQIQYLPAHPDKNRLAISHAPISLYFFTLLGAILALVGFGAGAYGLIGMAREPSGHNP